MFPGTYTELGNRSTTALQAILSKRENVTPNQFREFSEAQLVLMSETNTIIASCVMFIAILIAWNLPVLRDLIAGLKV
jgi:hypothetical protein